MIYIDLIDFKTRPLYHSQKSLSALQNKKLVLNSDCNIWSNYCKRYLKYVKQGYTPTQEAQEKFVEVWKNKDKYSKFNIS